MKTRINTSLRTRQLLLFDVTLMNSCSQNLLYNFQDIFKHISEASQEGAAVDVISKGIAWGKDGVFFFHGIHVCNELTTMAACTADRNKASLPGTKCRS